jgi:hypothetical protein
MTAGMHLLQGFPIKKSKFFLYQNDVCKEDLVMTSQDKWTQDSNFNLQPDFHALPLTQIIGNLNNIRPLTHQFRAAGDNHFHNSIVRITESAQ